MWKRWLIKIAWQYLEIYFRKWVDKLDKRTCSTIAILIANLENYLRTRRDKTSLLIADLLVDWRELCSHS